MANELEQAYDALRNAANPAEKRAARERREQYEFQLHAARARQMGLSIEDYERRYFSDAIFASVEDSAIASTMQQYIAIENQLQQRDQAAKGVEYPEH